MTDKLLSLAERDGMMPVGNRPQYANELFPFAIFNEEWAQRNHYQSLEQLAKRGGFSWCEAAANIERRKWMAMDKGDAEAIVRGALRTRNGTINSSSEVSNG